jgi:hypothetical protein
MSQPNDLSLWNNNQTFILKDGWNLVSFYVEIDLAYLNFIMTVVNTNIKEIVSQYDKFVPFHQLNTLTSIDYSKGYYIYVDIPLNNELQLNFQGNRIYHIVISLEPGWNLIGYPSKEITTIIEIDTTDIEIIRTETLGHDQTTTYQIWEKNASSNTLEQFEKNKGYC